MFPRTLIGSEVKSMGERRVFDALRNNSDDSWNAFHSVGWITRDHGAGTEDGEIDFVLAKVGEPLICIEVKGGGLECEHGEWYRLRDGEKKRFRDPFAQAVDHTYSLRRALGEFDDWKHRNVHIVPALSFPDITKHKLVLGFDAHPEIVIDKNELAEIEAALERVIAFHRGSRDKRKLLEADGLSSLRKLLAPEVSIKVPMATHFLDEEVELIELTHQQASLLKRRAGNKRMLVRGCAGSGKTMLAVEMAKRFRRDDRDVLFVCFNKSLRDHLAIREKDSEIRFQTFHGLCVQFAHMAGVELPDYPKGEAPQSFFREELPAALMEAVDELGPQFDVVIVDEAQDLHSDWLDALMPLLRTPEKDPVWLFMDDNQDVYGIGSDPPEGFVVEDLTVNCRNTQMIAAEVHKKYKGEVEPEMLGPEGREIGFYTSDDQPATVSALIGELCGEGEVPPQDIVVLSSHGFDNSAVAQSKPAGLEFVKEYAPLGNKVRCSSIRGFKGLEAPVVILCELEGIDEETMDMQLYVGFSRAKNHCLVVAPVSNGRDL